MELREILTDGLAGFQLPEGINLGSDDEKALVGAMKEVSCCTYSIGML